MGAADRGRWTAGLLAVSLAGCGAAGESVVDDVDHVDLAIEEKTTEPAEDEATEAPGLPLTESRAALANSMLECSWLRVDESSLPIEDGYGVTSRLTLERGVASWQEWGADGYATTIARHAPLSDLSDESIYS